MFTTARNLTNLVSADIIYGDGTFYTSPTQFTQLYTLRAMVDDGMYPLVFGLLPVKVKKYTTVTSTYSRPLVNSINFS
jgi:hypothetical protein